jgi:hypothetical protein
MARAAQSAALFFCSTRLAFLNRLSVGNTCLPSAVSPRRRIFRGFARFPARRIGAMWRYLPIAPGKNFRIRQFLPGRFPRAAIPAGPDFPPSGKIDG